MYSVEAIARVCHEANRALQILNHEDEVSSGWDALHPELKASVITGVLKVLEDSDVTARDMHEAWFDYKIEEGWQYGEVKDFEAKTHPQLVNWSVLPDEQKAKDEIFIGIVQALAPFMSESLGEEEQEDDSGVKIELDT